MVLIKFLYSVQIYGKHAGHDCKLATDIVTTTREELRGWSKRLGDNFDLIKKSRKKVIDTKDSIVNTQQYVRNRIVKHMGVLNACMRRREVVLKCEVDDRSKKKLELLDAQEKYASLCYFITPFPLILTVNTPLINNYSSSPNGL